MEKAKDYIAEKGWDVQFGARPLKRAIQKHIEDKPALKEVLSKVGVHKMRTIATMATKENQKELAEKLQTMSKPALELYAREQKAPRMEIPPGGDFKLLSFHVEPEVELELRKLKAKGETFNDVMKKLLAMAPKKTEPKPQKNPRPSNPKSRQASIKQRSEALLKTNGKCSIEGCNEPAAEIHHEDSWAIGRNHDKLKPLCRPHHELEHQTDSTIDKKFRAYKMQAAMF